MFTGIIDHCGKIIDIHRLSDRISLLIETQFKDLQLGESITVDGACLTVTAIENNHVFSCDLSLDTLNCTIASDYQVGNWVHLERALQLNDRLGGHLVTGHIDQTLTVDSSENQGEFKIIHFSLPANHATSYLIPKGSIAINGVSLTVNTLTPTTFSLTLIPQTLAVTQLKHLTAGATVNAEFDLITKIIVQQAHIIFKSMQPNYADENTLH